MIGYSYDPHGRLLQECRDPDGLNLCSTYNYRTTTNIPQWNLVRVTDPNQQATSYAYDGRGQLAKTTDATGAEWSFTYNNLGQLVYQSTPIGGVTTYTTNGHGQRLTETEGGRTQSWSYRADGALEAMTDFSGQTIDYVYASGSGNGGLDNGKDGLVSNITYGDSTANASYLYDAAGNLRTVTDSAGSTTYRYDGLNRLRDQTRTMAGGASYAVSYGYDATGNLTSLSYPTGGSVSYSYDDAGRMASMTPWSAPATSYHYRSSGLLDYQTRGNGARTDYAYDGAGRITSLTHAYASDASETIEYFNIDTNGNIKSRRDLDGVTTYEYDALNRLTDVSYPRITGVIDEQSVSYAYDAAGNRTTVNGRTEAKYDNQNRLSGHPYDANGNLLGYTASHSAGITSQPGDALDLSYAYDPANRLTQITATSSISTPGAPNYSSVSAFSAYTYDGLGQQIQRSVQDFTTDSTSEPTMTTDLVLGQHGGLSRVLAEIVTEQLNLSTVVTTRLYAYGPDGIAAQRTITSVEGSDEVDSIDYPLLDGLGTPRLVTDATGAALLRLSYDAFGEERLETTFGTGSTPYRFGLGLGGEPRDPFNGSIYLRARTYQPQAGRFTQRDSFGGFPSRPQSLNRYTYTENNPTTYLDPSGHSICAIPLLAGPGGALPAGTCALFWGAATAIGLSTTATAARTIDVSGAQGVLHTGHAWPQQEPWTETFPVPQEQGLQVLGFPTGQQEQLRVEGFPMGQGERLRVEGFPLGKVGGPIVLAASNKDIEYDLDKEKGIYRARSRNRYFYAVGRLFNGTLRLDFQLKYRNTRHPGLRGKEQFNAIIDFFGPENIDRIHATWVGNSDNLIHFNRSTRLGLPSYIAGLYTWTGTMAYEAGFTRIDYASINLAGSHGEFYRVELDYIR